MQTDRSRRAFDRTIARRHSMSASGGTASRRETLAALCSDETSGSMKPIDRSIVPQCVAPSRRPIVFPAGGTRTDRFLPVLLSATREAAPNESKNPRPVRADRGQNEHVALPSATEKDSRDSGDVTSAPLDEPFNEARRRFDRGRPAKNLSGVFFKRVE